MFNLKSELYKKEREVKQLQSQSTTHNTALLKASSCTASKKTPTWLKKNSGVEKRHQNDLLEIKEDKHSQVQAILEAKAKLYDNMTKGDYIPDSEDAQVFLVDFEQKSIDAWRERSEKSKETEKPNVNVKMSSEVMKAIDDVKDKWVEYVDKFGRTRTVLKSELAQLQEEDRQSKPGTSEMKTLMSDDMRREEERLKWEKSTIEEMQNEVHYENLRFGEIRELGVGYFAFSGKQTERDEQMKRLEKYRRETEKRKQENEAKKQKHQSALTSRLEKVRQRRIKQLQSQGKEIPASLLEPIKIEQKQTPSDETKPEPNLTVVETSESNDAMLGTPKPALNKTREWDKDKVEWQPAKPPAAPKSWLDPREERPSEFAPPDFYYASSNPAEADDSPPSKQPKQDKPEEQPADNERIQTLLSEIRSKATATNNPPPPSESTIPAPYTPSDKPISIKILSKPTKLLNSNKPTF